MSRRSTLCLVVLLASSGCSAVGGGDVVASGQQDGDGGGAGGGQNAGSDVKDLASISVEPALAELSAVDGSRPEEVFKAVGTRTDGTKTAIPNAVFTLASQAFGAIGQASGKFVATGVAGGQTQVRVEVPGPGGKPLRASATVRVELKRTFISTGAPADAADKFDKPAKPVVKDVAPNLVYPLEGAVMPQNVFPADVQWLTGKAGDLFELRFQKPNAVVRAIVLHSGAGFNNQYLVDRDGWRAMAQSDPDDPVVVTLKRWDVATGDVTESPTLSFSFARAALTGSVYYWEIKDKNLGRIQRIDDGTNVAISFMPSPPAGVKGAAEHTCVGCHSVSPSGRYMAGRLSGGENIGASFDLTINLAANPAPTLFSLVPKTDYSGSAQWWFSSWSPDEKRLVVSTSEGSSRTLRMLDPFAGTYLTVTGTLPSDATHPAWSPDGKDIAYVTNLDDWGGANKQGDIALIPVTGPDTVGKAQSIHSGPSLAASMPPGNADSYPSWSPDSKRIAFAHGGSSRSEDDPGNGFYASSALYMMGRDGGNVVRLDKACGGAATKLNFQPRFAPFDTGGHFWVSFLSRREYGNAQAGTQGSSRQQIWVAAIKKDAKPGEDPSEVGYWLPGQSTKQQNISAYWAPRPCRKDGEGCSVGSECCGGDCRPDDMGALVCSPPPPDECRLEGQTCSSNGDCCDGLPCTNNVCIQPVVIQ